MKLYLMPTSYGRRAVVQARDVFAASKRLTESRLLARGEYVTGGWEEIEKLPDDMKATDITLVEGKPNQTEGETSEIEVHQDDHRAQG